LVGVRLVDLWELGLVVLLLSLAQQLLKIPYYFLFYFIENSTRSAG
jgi:hypothetical protein